MQKKLLTAKIIVAALPYIKKFKHQTIVIKYGGSAQVKQDLKERFAEDIALLNLVGIKQAIVHGGGNRISEMLKNLSIESEFKNGLRVTNERAIKVAEMVLSGEINKEITTLLNNQGAKAIGINGKDGNFMKATFLNEDDYGYVGKIKSVDSSVLASLMSENFIPVIAPVAANENQNHIGLNINADLAASKISTAIKAEKIFFLTDTRGILDKDGKLISKLKVKDIQKLKDNGTITGGMIPKVDACIEALEGGVTHAHIIDGRIEHSILLELFTDDGIGTIISK